MTKNVRVVFQNETVTSQLSRFETQLKNLVDGVKPSKIYFTPVEESSVE